MTSALRTYDLNQELVARSLGASRVRAFFQITLPQIKFSVIISALFAFLTSFDEVSNDMPRLASLAKAKIGEVFHLVSNEAVQMHGGIGVTDEYDIGFYLKRARVAEQIFGNVQFHKDRYAELTGY